MVHERTCCVIVTYTGDREAVLSALGAFTWAGAESSVTLPGHSTRTLNREFQEKLVGKVAVKAATTLVDEGEITVNQASLTGESVPVAKRRGGAVYAGTVVEARCTPAP